ncbi:E3 ubiquitin/ISG15 ligase TRIM25 [Aplochiton taeniatus]
MGTVVNSLKCPICQDPFTGPVMLPCGHIFCLTCIRLVWNADTSSDGIFFCPECQIILPSDLTLEVNSSLQTKLQDLTLEISGPPVRLETAGSPSAITCDHCIEKSSVAVRTCLTCDASLCRAHAQLHHQREALREHTVVEVTEDPLSLKCKEHREELKLFCMEESMPVCSLCALVGLHKNHHAVQLPEACADLKSVLETNMSQLLKRKSVAEHAITDLESLYAETVRSAAAFRERISDKYSRIRAVLNGDERLMLRVVDTEETFMTEWLESQRGIMEDHIREIDTLRASSKALLREANDLRFLQQITAQRLGRPLDLVPIQGVEKDLCAPERMRTVERLVDELSVELSHHFPRMWSYLRTPTLDPESAHPNLEVSTDRLQVCWTRQPGSESPGFQRYDSQYSVLATEPLSAGVNYWEVIVQEKPYWLIGITTGPTSRKVGETEDHSSQHTERPSWCIYHCDGQYLACHDTQETLLPVEGGRVRKLGVLADLHKGELSFHDADRLTKLHCFSVKLAEPLYPMFNPCIDVNCLNRQPLTLLTLKDTPDRLPYISE